MIIDRTKIKEVAALLEQFTDRDCMDLLELLSPEARARLGQEADPYFDWDDEGDEA